MPCVTTSAVLAPLRSISVLIAMVEPWISSSIAPTGAPLFWMQSMMPCDQVRPAWSGSSPDESAGLIVEGDQVGERAADVDRNEVHGTFHPV